MQREPIKRVLEEVNSLNHYIEHSGEWEDLPYSERLDIYADAIKEIYEIARGLK